MVDLQSQYKKIKHEVDKSVIGIMEEATFINGPIVKAFQKNLEECLVVQIEKPYLLSSIFFRCRSNHSCTLFLKNSKNVLSIIGHDSSHKSCWNSCH